MDRTKARIGLDVGGVFVKTVVLDADGRVLHRRARRHHGNPVSVAREELKALDISGPIAVGITGSYAPLVTGGLNLLPVDFVNAEIKSVRNVFPEARNIINVGGSSVTLIHLDQEGNFLDYSTNSLCAAGTGSFLDQQAERLGIQYEDMESVPHSDSPPPIATRCSVFAKTDLIHRQQEGYDKSALWCGLCKSMTGTFLNTLLRGRPLKGLTVLTGGVSRNREVMRWLMARYGDMVRTFEDAPYSCAIGAAHMTNGHVDTLEMTSRSLRDTAVSAADAPRRPPLQFRKSRYPSFDVEESYTDAAGNEVRVTLWPTGAAIKAFIGIDVGSTSTKALLVDAEGNVIADVYRRTSGDPIGATKQLFTAIAELASAKNSGIAALGVGATGSGRKLVGQVVGADLIVNEISAHLAGAMHVDPRVDTIFEIGGQDSKYIRARNGRIYDSSMNYVCAAGTGSFVEEQARRLGMKLEEIGDDVMGVAPPLTSDRCTVFMEQDVDRLLRRGYSPTECMAAVLYSVVRNYLNKVVGRRQASRERIFFQGATARNKGLVAAFENLLDVEMVVSPYCHVMGAYGAALLARAAVRRESRPTSFKGLDLSRRSIGLRNETCTLCQNHCKITFAEIEGESHQPSWGYMCGRDADSKKMRANREFAPFQTRMKMLTARGKDAPLARTAAATKTVGIPRCLTTYSLYPLWRTLFEELGFKTLLSGPTDEEVVRLGGEFTAADFCFPIKVAHGQAALLAQRKDVDFLFLPHVICAEKNPKTTNSYYCPYVQAFPSAVRSALTVHGVDASRLLSPVVDFSLWPLGRSKELAKGLVGPLGVTKSQVRRAWSRAVKAQRDFERRRKEEGRRLLAEIEASGKPVIAVIGRPYNTLDEGATLSLPRKIAELGLTVIPMDMLPYDIRKINPFFSNMYWSYGQHILSAVEFVRNHKQLYGIYFTNFSCGPDSFLLSLSEEVMGEKPMLTLELDEHGGDAGYLTRIEAFLDVVRAWTPRSQPPFHVPEPKSGPDAIRGRKVWLPNMHPIGGPLYAAALRSGGLDAESLPPETPEAFEAGRAVTRGSECLPTACTTGTFLHLMDSRGLDPREHALFIPTSDGPCRFGQYATLQRLVLNRVGKGDTALLSPCSSNSYGGLNQRARWRLWHGLLAGDVIWKAACKVRPYETTPGTTDAVVAEEIERLSKVMESGRDVRPACGESIRRIAAVPMTAPGSRPLVGVVGEIYVRCNPFSNDQVIRAIERFGGEAWLSPISEWILYSAVMQQWRTQHRPLHLPRALGVLLKNHFIMKGEREFQEVASPFLDDRREPEIHDVLKEGERYVPMNFLGEAILTLGRAVHFAKQGAAMVVNVAPFGCMPGTITSALCREIQAETSVPIVSLFYDGEPGMNQRLEVFLTGLAQRKTGKF
jgi:predicted CoA-substrate-specific enzyme activase